MSIKTSKKDPAVEKSEFLSELAAGHAKWTKKGNVEYAAAYEHMICALTSPPSTEKIKTT